VERTLYLPSSTEIRLRKRATPALMAKFPLLPKAGGPQQQLVYNEEKIKANAEPIELQLGALTPMDIFGEAALPYTDTELASKTRSGPRSCRSKSNINIRASTAVTLLKWRREDLLDLPWVPWIRHKILSSNVHRPKDSVLIQLIRDARRWKSARSTVLSSSLGEQFSKDRQLSGKSNVT